MVRCKHAGAFCGDDGYCHLGDCFKEKAEPAKAAEPMKPANNAPVYASIYHELAEVTREFGYALAIHGSLARDFDLIAIPWTENPARPEAAIAELEHQFALKATGELTPMLHGRLCQTFVFAGGDAFVDLSFMPVVR